jgi:large subunit ribosomal protein L4
MYKARYYKSDGKKGRARALPDVLFDGVVNEAVLHRVVKAHLANQRQGTHAAKNRAAVAGGSRKPWRQKGTGRARQGSTRSPQWTGGGVAHAPKPRSYRQKTPKKMVQLALRSALSDRAAEGRVVVVDAWDFGTTPKTRLAKAALGDLGVEGRALVVVTPDDNTPSLSFRNLPDVHVLLASELNAYDVLCSDWVVFTRDSLPAGGQPGVAGTAEPEPAPAPQAASPDEEAGE